MVSGYRLCDHLEWYKDKLTQFLYPSIDSATLLFEWAGSQTAMPLLFVKEQRKR
jgi:hypothetical protein